MKCSIFNLAGATLIAAMSMSANDAVRYVKTGGGGTGSGLSWANAYSNPQQAFDAAADFDVIAVATGTYYPPGTASDRTRTFTLFENMRAYGGFNGTETISIAGGSPTESEIQSFLRKRNLHYNKTTSPATSAPRPPTRPTIATTSSRSKATAWLLALFKYM